jgi:hypothetical protein
MENESKGQEEAGVGSRPGKLGGFTQGAAGRHRKDLGRGDMVRRVSQTSLGCLRSRAWPEAYGVLVPTRVKSVRGWALGQEWSWGVR